MSDILNAALAYAALGWKVFPCRSADLYGAHSGKLLAKAKTPLLQARTDADGKPIKGSGWPEQASSNPQVIRDWWTRWPEALIGLPTGKNIGAFAIDFDPRHDAKTGEVFTLADLKAGVEKVIGEALPPSWTALTQSGGVHVFYALPAEGAPPGNGKGTLPAHVDVRGEGGYVIAAPSVMPNGNGYKWLRSPEDQPLAAAPASLLKAMAAKASAKPKAVKAPAAAASVSKDSSSDFAERIEAQLMRYADKSLANAIAAISGAGDGTRNVTLNTEALKMGHLIAAGMLDEDAVAAALERAAADCGLMQSDGARAVHATIESGLTAGKAEPTNVTALRARFAADEERRLAARLARSPRASGALREDGTAGDSEGGSGSPPRPAGVLRPKKAPSSLTGGSGPFEKCGPGGESWGYGGRDLDAKGRRDFDEGCAAYAATDVGNLYRFLQRFGCDFRFTREKGWLAWDGKRWKIEGEQSSMLDRAILQMIELIRVEAAAVFASRADAVAETTADGVHRHGLDYVVAHKSTGYEWWSDVLRKWYKSSQSAGKLGTLPKMITAHVLIDVAALDAQPWLLAVSNGTLKFISHEEMKRPETERPAFVELLPHRRSDYITLLANVAYDATATCTDYDAFLAEVQPAPEMRDFLHVWAGYNLTGDTSAQCFLWHHGEGANGKSTFNRCMEIILNDNAKAIQVETLLAQQFSKAGSGPSEDLAELMGVRCVSAGEPEVGAQISEGLVKKLTGADQIPARHNYGKFFRYTPRFKIQVHSNPLPKVLSSDEAIRRRFNLVHWGVKIERQNRHSPEHFERLFTRESSGILNHYLAGLARFMREGLKRPDSVQVATDKFFDDKDVVGRFLTTCVAHVDVSGYEGTPYSQWPKVQATAMFDLFVAWCRVNGESSKWSQKGFSPAVAAKGFRSQQISVMFWLGVRLLYAPSDFIDEATGRAKILSDDPIARCAAPDGADVAASTRDDFAF